MTALDPALAAHLASGATTTCRCWTITRADAVVLGFTDHDRDLAVEGVAHRADSGLHAAAIQQSTGLSVDNASAVGALSALSLREEELLAGRYDDAAVLVRLVNWADPSQAHVLFRGRIGEVKRGSGAFEAELVGLSEMLNRPIGRVFQKTCDARLGDARCGVDLSAPGMVAETVVVEVERPDVLVLPALTDFADGWFEQGTLTCRPGAAGAEVRRVKSDRPVTAGRRIVLWEELRGGVAFGDALRLTAGCDKTVATCSAKFANIASFQGYPHLPGDDWLAAVPSQAFARDGGSMNR